MKGKNTLLLLSLLLVFNIFFLHSTVGFYLIISLGEFGEVKSKIFKCVQIYFRQGTSRQASTTYSFLSLNISQVVIYDTLDRVFFSTPQWSWRSAKSFTARLFASGSSSQVVKFSKRGPCEGVLLVYKSCIGMRRCEEYGFQAV